MARHKTLCDLINSMPALGDKPMIRALRKEGMEVWSFARMDQSVRRLAKGLVKAGLQPGDPVAMVASNRPEWITACLASLLAGAVVVPLDVQFPQDALQHALNDSSVKFVVTTRDQLARFHALEFINPPKYLLFEEEKDHTDSYLNYGTDDAITLPVIPPDALALLFYTSGTTGMPKGVPLDHQMMIYSLNAMIDAKLVYKTDVMLLPLPLHHTYPFLMGNFYSLAEGIPLVMPYSLTGPQLTRAIKEGGATALLGVPRLYQALAAGIKQQVRRSGILSRWIFNTLFGLSFMARKYFGLYLGKTLLRPLHQRMGAQMRIMASGGSALDPGLGSWLEAIGWEVAIGYGLTETSAVMCWNRPGEYIPGSVGRPLPGDEIKLDTSAVDAPPGQGEILAKGPNIFRGYHNLPEKTAEVFTPDGWFRTGDLGYFDSKANLYVLGRISSIIVTQSGEKIQPDEVEEVYQLNRFIEEIGILPKEGKLVAVVVPDLSEIRMRGNNNVEKSIRHAITEQSKELASYKRVSDYVISREGLPRTRLGKLRRHLLLERFFRAKEGQELSGKALSIYDMSPADRVLMEDSLANQTWEWITQRYPDKRITPDTSPQFDLGIDSIEWLNLGLEIRQRTGVELSENAIGRINTVRDLMREVSEHADEVPGVEIDFQNPDKTLSPLQKRWLEPLTSFQKAIYFLGYHKNRLFCRWYFKLHVEGLENLPKHGPMVLCPNHVSLLDPFVIGAAIDLDTLQETFWGGWQGIAFTNPFNRFGSRIARVVPLEPDRALYSSLSFGAWILKNRHNLIWFPEGQRTRDGLLGPFKSGIGLLVTHFDAPIVPVYIDGTYQSLPYENYLPKRVPVTIRFGKPLSAKELAEQGEGEHAHQRIASALRQAVQSLEKPHV